MADQTYVYAGVGAADAGDVDEVRFLVQDVGDDNLWLLSDQEYQWLIDQWMPRYSSLLYVAAVAAATISRKFVGLVSVSADGVSVNTADLAQRYRDLAVALRDEFKAAQIGEGPDIENLLIGYSVDRSIKPLRFAVGLHDNPEAGAQDYGGWTYDPFGDLDVVLAGDVP